MEFIKRLKKDGVLSNYQISQIMNFVDFDYDKDQMRLVLEGIMKNMDVSYYANKNFNALQMKEIFLGLINNVDVSQYADSTLTAEIMRERRIKLINNSL